MCSLRYIVSRGRMLELITELFILSRRESFRAAAAAADFVLSFHMPPQRFTSLITYPKNSSLDSSEK